MKLGAHPWLSSRESANVIGPIKVRSLTSIGLPPKLSDTECYNGSGRTQVLYKAHVL